MRSLLKIMLPAVLVAVVGVDSASAQPRSRFYRRPTVSPYLNLINPNVDQAGSYYTFVRPAQQYQQNFAQMSRGLQQIERQVNTQLYNLGAGGGGQYGTMSGNQLLNIQNRQNPLYWGQPVVGITGHPTGFGMTGNYFMSSGGRPLGRGGGGYGGYNMGGGFGGGFGGGGGSRPNAVSGIGIY